MFNIDDFLATQKWPEFEDKLIRADGGATGYVGAKGRSRLVVMGEGYMEAANILVDHAARSISEANTLAYPILFLYRHALELDLKYIIETYGRGAGENPVLDSHDLERLWQSVQRILRHYGDHDESGAKNVGRAIAEFSKLDPKSENFRYATNRKGAQIGTGVEHVSLTNLREVMQGIHNYFTGTDGLLDSGSEY
jgi:hypothetical protein